MILHLFTILFSQGNTVQFNDDGTREIDTIIVYQYWWNESSKLTNIAQILEYRQLIPLYFSKDVSELIRGTLGTIKISENKSTFNYSHSFSAASPGVWPGKNDLCITCI